MRSFLARARAVKELISDLSVLAGHNLSRGVLRWQETINRNTLSTTCFECHPTFGSNSDETGTDPTLGGSLGSFSYNTPYLGLHLTGRCGVNTLSNIESIYYQDDN